MSVIKRMRKQFCVLWRRTGYSETGASEFDEPVQLRCRWDDCAAEYRNDNGEKALSKSTAYPETEVSIGDRMKVGELDSETALNPLDDDLALEVVGFEKIPNFKAKEFLLIAYMGQGGNSGRSG